MPDSLQCRAFYFDGTTAYRHDVTVEDADDGLRIMALDGSQIGGVAYADLMWQKAENGLPVFGMKGVEGWRIGFISAPSAPLSAKLPRPEKYGGFIDRIGLGGAMIGFAVISAAMVAAIVASPQWLAPLVPYSWEQKLGDAMVGDFGGRLCDTPDGLAAVAKLEAKLDARGQDLDVRIANIDMVNAVALPGGKIIIFQGLLNEAKSADEIAGVLAHEIGHVRRRHVMQSLLRQMGLSVLLGGVDGQAGGAMNTLLSMAYGRDAEREADGWSIDRMAKARIDPTDTADFFRRMGMEPDDAPKPKIGADGKKVKQDEAQSARVERALSYITTHPANADRRRAFMDSKKPDVAYIPALTDAEWTAVTTMCAQDKDVKDGGDDLF